MIIEIESESLAWPRVKHALREAGLRYLLQEQLFSPNKTLFVEPRGPEPEDGKLSHGLIVYEGGAAIYSPIQEIYNEETRIPSP